MEKKILLSLLLIGNGCLIHSMDDIMEAVVLNADFSYQDNQHSNDIILADLCRDDVRRKPVEAQIALCKSCASGNYQLAQKLLQIGVRVNEKDGNGQTPLAHALINRHESIVMLLRNHNVDVNQQFTAQVNGRSTEVSPRYFAQNHCPNLLDALRDFPSAPPLSDEDISDQASAFGEDDNLEDSVPLVNNRPSIRRRREQAEQERQDAELARKLAAEEARPAVRQQPKSAFWRNFKNLLVKHQDKIIISAIAAVGIGCIIYLEIRNQQYKKQKNKAV